MPMIPAPLRRWLVPWALRLEYAPQGWATPLPAGAGSAAFWTHFIAQERASCAALMASVRAGEDVLALDADERAKRAAFGEVLAIAAARKPRLAILDVGGNLGDYYWIGKALLPEVEIDFHCRELPAIAAAGREINPAVTFHDDDRCFDQPYDLTMFSSSLQCFQDWRAALGRAARSARDYVFLSDIPAVQKVPSYVVAHHLAGKVTLQYQLNQHEVIGVAEREGCQVVRKFEMGPHPPVINAPEQAHCIGWLFQRQRK